MTAWARLCGVLSTGPIAFAMLSWQGARPATALAVSLACAVAALWSVRALPVHFAPLLALLLCELFLAEPGVNLMAGLGLDPFWWMLGSMMLALAAWETGLTGMLMQPQGRLGAFAARLAAGLPGLAGTRAAPLLAPFARQDGRWGRAGATLARLVFLPGHVLNLFALALLPPALGTHLTLLGWATLFIIPGAALAWLAAAPAACPAGTEGSRAAAPLRLSGAQQLAALALLMGLLGPALAGWHGLPPGVWCLFIGLMVLSAGLLPEARLARGIDWPLLLALGVTIGLYGAIAPPLQAALDDAVGTASAPGRALVLAALLPLFAWAAVRVGGLVRGALVALPLAGIVAAGEAQQGAGWILLTLLTLHWCDLCGTANAGGRSMLRAVAGVAVLALTGLCWYLLGVL